MTDLGITKFCAIAMGWRIEKTPHLNAPEAVTAYGPEGCGVESIFAHPSQVVKRIMVSFDPLHDDAQAMALVKRCQLFIMPEHEGMAWNVSDKDDHKQFQADSDDLNRAICECVAKMQKAKA